MDRDKEDLAVALWIQKKHGATGAAYIAEQIGRLALENDTAGIARWKSIAVRFEALSQGTVNETIQCH